MRGAGEEKSGVRKDEPRTIWGGGVGRAAPSLWAGRLRKEGIPLPVLPATETQRSAAGTCSNGATSNRAAAAVTKQNLKGVKAV